MAIVTCDLDLGPGRLAGPTRPIAPPKVIDRWSTLIRLAWPLQRVGASHIHGLRRRDLIGAPSMRSALRAVGERLRDVIPVAHNAPFDTDFLLGAGRRYGVDLGIEPVVCTLSMSRSLDPERLRSHRLGDLCEQLGITLDRPHDALHDAEATAALLPHLLAATGVSSTGDLERFAYRTSPGDQPVPSDS